MTIQEIIEKIRAEVERKIQQIKDAIEKESDAEMGTYLSGKVVALKEHDFFLSTLEKECEKPINVWSNTPIKAKVKETGKYIMGFTDGKGHLHIPVDHNSFLQYNIDELEFDTLQEQPVEVQKYRAYLISEIEKQYKQAERNYQEAYEQKNETRMFDEAERDAWKRVLDWLKEGHGYDSSNEDLIPEQGQLVDLDEEIDRFLSNATPITKGENKGKYIISRLGFKTVARHFYELGKQSKKRELLPMIERICVSCPEKVKAESGLDKFTSKYYVHCSIEHCPGVKACYTSSNKQLQ